MNDSTKDTNVPETILATKALDHTPSACGSNQYRLTDTSGGCGVIGVTPYLRNLGKAYDGEQLRYWPAGGAFLRHMRPSRYKYQLKLRRLMTIAIGPREWPTPPMDPTPRQFGKRLREGLSRPWGYGVESNTLVFDTLEFIKPETPPDNI